jgi:hypothetical protein
MPSFVTAAKISGDRGNVDVTLQNGENEVQRFNTPLTAARAIKLPKPADNGDRFHVLRLAGATGAFNLNVQAPDGTLIKAMTTAGTFAEFTFSDALGWVQVAAGTL